MHKRGIGGGTGGRSGSGGTGRGRPGGNDWRGGPGGTGRGRPGGNCWRFYWWIYK